MQNEHSARNSGPGSIFLLKLIYCSDLEIAILFPLPLPKLIRLDSLREVPRIVFKTPRVILRHAICSPQALFGILRYYLVFAHLSTV